MKIAKRLLITAFSALALSGCVTVNDINAGFYRIGKAWQLDNQKDEDEYRYRVIESDYLNAVDATRKTFIALGMPVQSVNLEDGSLVAENVAPAPLNKAEWLEVKRIETPRLQELGGKLFYFEDDPKSYTITVRAKFRRLDGGRILVAVDYVMDSPTLRSMGVVVPSNAPPSAVRFGSVKFWAQLESELKARNISPLRKRKWDENS